MAEYKLADLLLRRKELQGKVDVLSKLQNKELFEVKAKRVKVTDDVEDFLAQVPKLTASQVTAEYDFYARQLRVVDSAIQQANWTTGVNVNESVMSEYKAPDVS